MFVPPPPLPQTSATDNYTTINININTNTAAPFPQKAIGTSPKASLFMFAVILSRVGLYGFDVGFMELQQRQVDEKHRNAVGAVESSLQNMGTIGINALAMGVTSPAQFVHVSWTSTMAVCIAAATYGVYIAFWHEHEHRHPEVCMCVCLPVLCCAVLCCAVGKPLYSYRGGWVGLCGC